MECYTDENLEQVARLKVEPDRLSGELSHSKAQYYMCRRITLMARIRAPHKVNDVGRGLLTWRYSSQEGTITAPDAWEGVRKEVADELHKFRGKVYSRFRTVLNFDANNAAVWEAIEPTYDAFTKRQSICITFDGYTRSGKSHTLIDQSD